jgi:hypothetical protein
LRERLVAEFSLIITGAREVFNLFLLFLLA